MYTVYNALHTDRPTPCTRESQGEIQEELEQPLRDEDEGEELMELLERLNSLNSVDHPHVPEEGVRLLETARSRGIKDLRVYNVVFQVRGPSLTLLPHTSPHD